jgi:hypothetical protein
MHGSFRFVCSRNLPWVTQVRPLARIAPQDSPLGLARLLVADSGTSQVDPLMRHGAGEVRHAAMAPTPMKNTKIEYVDHSWSPWYGCTKISPGCANCFAERWGRLASDAKWRERAIQQDCTRTKERLDGGTRHVRRRWRS